MNAPLIGAPRVLPFFFDLESGTRFCLYHAPDPRLRARGAILYVHPFAEELNKTRRMAALQARVFAGLGFAVLQIDLFGCGDSDGDFGEARWQRWKDDLGVACDWLGARVKGPLHLWGLRLGALLALDVATTRAIDGLILWQPFLNGRACVNQFLRPPAAARVGGDGSHARRTGASALRASLAARGALEVGGYELAAALAEAIDACRANTLALPPCTVHWFTSGAPARPNPARGAARMAARWAALGVQVRFHQVDGFAFWSGGAQRECPALLEATSAVFAAERP
jgi:exosortase A-associated hydrolase 2